MGVDAGAGIGASNSVIAVFARRKGGGLGDLVAEYVDPLIRPHELVSLCCQVGRKWWKSWGGEAFICWEEGGPGLGMYKDFLSAGYEQLYTQRRVGTRGERRTRAYGWRPTQSGKSVALAQLRSAMSRDEAVVPSVRGLNEMADYIMYDSGEIGPGMKRDESSGARASHGDRVVAYMLALQGILERDTREKDRSKLRPGGMGDVFGMGEVLKQYA